MGELVTCEDCGKWEEKVYWTHFRTLHFFQFLTGDFANELAIPKKFANHLKEKLPATVTLKGPSGTTWSVELETSGDTLFFKNGWKEFLIDHSLKDSDLLIFKYNGDSRFDVLMLDSWSSCEKESSYFVRKCVHKSPVLESKKLKERGEGPEEAINVDEVVECPISKKPRNDDTVLPMPAVRRNAPRAKRKVWKNVQSIKPVNPPPLRRKVPSTPEVVKKAKSVEKAKSVFVSTNDSKAEQNSSDRSGSGGYQLQYISNRRPITEAEKAEALLLAQATSTNECFIIVMHPTHVYKRFYLRIPLEWANSHLSRRNQDMILLYKEKSWSVRYNRDNSRGGGGINSGWRQFAVENNLEEFDVCRFEPGSPTGNTFVMNVSIFRVVEQLNPLTQVTSASTGKKKLLTQGASASMGKRKPKTARRKP